MRAPKGIFVGDGVSGLIAGDLGEVPLPVAVFCDDDPGCNLLAQTLPGGSCHLPCGLSHRYQEYPAGKGASLKHPLDCPIWQNCLYRLLNDLCRLPPHRLLKAGFTPETCHRPFTTLTGLPSKKAFTLLTEQSIMR